MSELRRRRRQGGHEEERLSALLDDELPEHEALAVTRHVVSCPRCERELDAIRSARGALRGLPGVAPPQGLFAQALTAAEAEVSRRRGRTRRAAAFAATAATLAAVAFLAGAERGTVRPPIDIFVVDHVDRSGPGWILTPVNLSGR